MDERGLSLQIIMDITGRKGYNNIVLQKTLEQYPALEREKKAFVTECVNGTLRRMITLDYVINRASKINTRRMDSFILNLLRISVYQLAYMDRVPAHSVCDEAVKLAEASRFKALKGFVNGVLRTVAAGLPETLAGIEGIRLSDPVVFMEVKYSFPRAVTETLSGYIGEDETENMLEYLSNSYKPPVAVCVNTLKTDKEELVRLLEAEGVNVSPGRFMENALLLRGVPGINRLKAYRDGLFHVMDESSMLAVKIAAPHAGQKMLDICAAPGGKAFMAAYMTGGDCHIDACDIYEHKIKLIDSGTKRLGIKSINTKLWDASVFDESRAGLYDVVLADTPCSGLGLIGKKPDIRYNFEKSIISKLQGLQRKILNTCREYVKPGGTLVYSTCTLTAEENEKNADWIKKTLGFESAEILVSMPGCQTAESSNRVRLLPHKTGSDGFFIAKFTRKS